MLKVGLTGGIGCGKSTAVDAFRVYGIPIVDADQIAKDIVGVGQPALELIKKEFGAEVLLENGELNRQLLKENVFSNPKSLDALESILHPLIRAEITKRINQVKTAPYVIVDIPLLVEKGYQEMFNKVIVVDCLPEQQLKRVKLRSGMSDAEILKIRKHQATREERIKIATDILDNTGDIDTLHSQIKTLHNKFLTDN